MKKLSSFLAGMLVMLLIGSLGVGALAATNALTITVDPSIKIQVNGSEFYPKDAKGTDVITFVYEGTTYAPVRALAEAFGLEVGYDEVAKMATVGRAAAPEMSKTDYSDWTAEEIVIMLRDDFESVFEIKVQRVGSENDTLLVGSYPTSNFNPTELVKALSSIGSNSLKEQAAKDLSGVIELYPNHKDIIISYWTNDAGAAQVFMSIRLQNGKEDFTYSIVE